jgi:hypothetical protein
MTGEHRFYNTLPPLVALIERYTDCKIDGYWKAYLGRVLQGWAEREEEYSFTTKVHFSGTHVKYAIETAPKNSPKAKKQRQEDQREMQLLKSVTGIVSGVKPASIFVDGQTPSWKK